MIIFMILIKNGLWIAEYITEQGVTEAITSAAQVSQAKHCGYHKSHCIKTRFIIINECKYIKTKTISKNDDCWVTLPTF